MRYFDVNAWLGEWPFRSLRDNTPEALIARLERAGIGSAAVSQIEGMFHRHPQPANEKLAAAVAPHLERLVPIATINPRFPNWEVDLARCQDDLGMKGVRLFPQYHDYAVDGAEGRRLIGACRERGLPVFIPHRVEDVRQRNWMDPGRVVDLNQVANVIASEPEATIVIPNARSLSGSPIWNRKDLRDGLWYFDLSLAEVHYVLHMRLGRLTDLAEFIEQGGEQHLLFGTHTPFSYPSAARVKSAVLPVTAEVLEDINYNTSAKMLGVEVST
jgi:predicted TIM-barrel fold metal-dependent hydrolase